jgi:hypothetical protein
MPDFVVDLDLCISAPGAHDAQLSVAVVANDRSDAATVAILIAGYLDFDGIENIDRRPYEVLVAAVEDGIDDGFDEDWRAYPRPIGSGGNAPADPLQ